LKKAFQNIQWDIENFSELAKFGEIENEKVKEIAKGSASFKCK
jgi:hypothetical protein